MKVSIITPTFNSVKTLEDTLQSVFSQTYNNIEYIVIDGASTDGTQDLVARYADKVSVFISEKDKGIYDAMNKGISKATGDIIGILNSDDMLADTCVVEKIVEQFSRTDAEICYGNIFIVSQEDTSKIRRIWKPGIFSKWKLFFGWAPPHPAFYATSRLYRQLGSFTLSLPIAADYELMIRFLREKPNPQYLDLVCVKMREGGNSSKSILQRLRGLSEVYRSWVHNNWFPSPLLFVRILVKVPQYFLREEN